MSETCGLEGAVNEACESLPEGWNISFEMELWSGWVTLHDPAGNAVPVDYDTSLPMAEWVREAIRVAKQITNPER